MCNSVNLKPVRLLNRTKNSNTYCIAACRRKPLLLSMHMNSFLFLVTSIILTGVWDSIGVTCFYSALLSSLAVFAVITTRLKEYPICCRVETQPNMVEATLQY